MNKSFAKVLAVIVVLSGMVFGQAASQHCDVATTTVNSLLKVLPRGTVRVCQDQATPADPNLACSPLTNIYTDELATTLAPNPVTADALGNFCYFAPKGRVTQQVCSAAGDNCTVRTGMYITTGAPNAAVATPTVLGTVKAPNCAALGANYFPSSLNPDGSWNCTVPSGTFNGSYLTLTDKPLLGTAATHAETDFTPANQLGTVPLCNGFAPSNGQALQYTTSKTPNPCYTSVTVAIGNTRFATNETPVGLIDGINTIFTLANTPKTNTLMLFRNGVLQTITTMYTLVNNTITFQPTFLPIVNDSLTATYQY